MKKKVFILRCAKILCLVLCLVLLLELGADLCKHHDFNTNILAGFYAEPKNSLDVVLIGASEVFTGFSSGYAYDQYGFTSYPYAYAANPGKLYLSQLREVLKYQDPKLIVVEINGFLYDTPDRQTYEPNIRKYLNNIPASYNWFQTIVTETPVEEWPYYFFPLTRDHSNWKSICENMPLITNYFNIKNNGSILKGNVTYLWSHDASHTLNLSNDYTCEDLEPLAEEYLRSFLDYCNKNQVDNVLFIRFPHDISNEAAYSRFCKANKAGQIIQEYGFDFINFERENKSIDLDYTTDFYNSEHLSFSGQKKFTAYFGKLLIENYGVGKSNLSISQKEKWDLVADYTNRFYKHCEEMLPKGISNGQFETRHLLEMLNKQS